MTGNTIDELMKRIQDDPLLATAKDIDEVVDYFRSSFRNNEGSAKFKRTGDEADKPKVDLLKAVGLKKEAPGIVRRRI